jgi:hypothetical protein
VVGAGMDVVVGAGIVVVVGGGHGDVVVVGHGSGVGATKPVVGGMPIVVPVVGGFTTVVVVGGGFTVVVVTHGLAWGWLSACPMLITRTMPIAATTNASAKARCCLRRMISPARRGVRPRPALPAHRSVRFSRSDVGARRPRPAGGSTVARPGGDRYESASSGSSSMARNSTLRTSSALRSSMAKTSSMVTGSMPGSFSRPAS